MTKDEVIKAVGARTGVNHRRADIGEILDALEQMQQLKFDPSPETPREAALRIVRLTVVRIPGQPSRTMVLDKESAERIIRALEANGLCVKANG